MAAPVIHPTSIVDKRAEIADGVEIGPYCVIDGPVKLAAGVKLISHISVAGDTEIGEDTKLFPFVSVGHPPQDLKYKGERTKLIIGKNCTLREHVTMNPGTVSDRGITTVGDNCYFMMSAHVAHDCQVGNNVIFANCGTLGGSVTVEDNVIISGLAAVHQFTRIGRHAFVGGMAAVAADVIPYGSVVGNHARLMGLNITGLKRRGFTREQIQDMRAAYRLLFAEEGTFQERLDDVTRIFEANPEVQEIVRFIRSDSKRAICMPERRDTVNRTRFAFSGNLRQQDAMSSEQENRQWRKEQRAWLLAERLAMPKPDHRTACAAITQILAEELLRQIGPKVVGAYWPIRGEYDCRPLLSMLHKQGVKLGLPVVAAPDAPLEFHAWKPGDLMQDGPLNIPQPSKAVPVTPDCLLIPVVAFDARNYRLGYGAGFYDRTLAQMTPRPVTIGTAFAFQRLDDIRPHAYDLALDLIVTENGIQRGR